MSDCGCGCYLCSSVLLVNAWDDDYYFFLVEIIFVLVCLRFREKSQCFGLAGE